MTRARLPVTLLALSVAVVVTVLGVTWASDTPTPRLERSSSATLFDAVHLTPGAPIERCAQLVPRGAGLIAAGFDGDAVGSLAADVRLRVERGSGTATSSAGCVGFVPLATVYDGPLDDLPPASASPTTAVAIEQDRPVVYRATLRLDTPAIGETRFALRVTGVFGDAPPAPVPGPSPSAPSSAEPAAAAALAPERCVQLASTARVGRTVRAGRVRLTVRTPAELPVQLARSLPVYVTSTSSRAPRVRAGTVAVRLGRTPGGRWIGHVPVPALHRAQSVQVRSGRARITVPLRNGPCDVRVRTFLRADGTVDLRVDAKRTLTGLDVRLPRALGRLGRGTLRVRRVDGRGHLQSARARVSSRGRASDDRRPRIRISGRRIQVLDAPAGLRSLSLRLQAARADRVRPSICRQPLPTRGDVVTETLRDRRPALRRAPVRAPLQLIGDRCPS